MAEVRAIYGKIKLTDEASGAINKLKSSMNGFKEGLHNVNHIMEAMGGSYIVEKFREFGAELIHAAAEEETQVLRLKHLAGEGYDVLKESIEGAVTASKGLADESDLAAASNAALKFGASIDFVRNNIQTMQQLSHVMGTDINETFQGIQNAINTGSIRFLRQSPILVQHIAEFKRLGTGYDEVTKKRRELFITQIMSAEQLKISQQYAEVLETTNGLLGRVSTQWHKMKEIMGGVLLVAFKPILKYLGNLMEWLTKDQDRIALLKVGFLTLASVAILVLIPALYSAVTAFAALMGVSKGFLMTVGGIALALVSLFLVVEDVYQYFKGGESVTGQWVDTFKGLNKQVKEFGRGIDNLPAIKKINSALGFDPEKNPTEPKRTAVDDAISGFLQQHDILGIDAWKNTLGFGNKPKGKAAGGLVNQDNTYLVGEKGPELFTPSVDGNIIPNSKLGGEKFNFNTLVGNLTINVSGSKEAGQAVEMAVMDALNKLGRTIMRTEMGMQAV